MAREQKAIRHKGYSVKATRPRGMKLYSVVVAGGRAREIINCRSRTYADAIEHGKEFVDTWIAAKKGLGR